MQSTTILRTGLPTRRLIVRILTPLGVVLVLFSAFAGSWLYSRLEDQTRLANESTAWAIFNTHWTVQGDGANLASLPDYERVWILDATGNVLASNRMDEVGFRLENRWLMHLDASASGTFSYRVPFGDGEMTLSGVHDKERGRWVVLLDQSSTWWAAGAFAGGIVLGLSLIFWSMTALLVSFVLGKNVSGALQKLDLRTIQLVKGESISGAALDRLSRETTPVLGGHADCVVDLARQLMISRSCVREGDSQFNTLFDATTDLGLIRGNDGSILSVNRALCDEMNVQKDWLVGKPFQVLQDLLPVRLLEEWFARLGSDRIGVNRMELYPGEEHGIGNPVTITLQPITIHSTTAWLLLVTKREEIFAESESVETGVLLNVSRGMAPSTGEPGKNVRDS